MTQREQELFDIISANPMISQNEIAKLMGTTRSAVSVYLNNLYKSGVILGRGYIIAKDRYPLIIGPGTVDIRSIVIQGENISGVENVETRLNYGGSAKNTAEHLINFYMPPKAMFILGGDELGEAFCASCEKIGIDSSNSILLDGHSTPVYSEFTDENRNFLRSAGSGTNLLESLPISSLDLIKRKELLKSANTFLVHDSISGTIIEHLHTSYPYVPIHLVGSSSRYLGFNQKIYSLVSCTTLSLSIAAKLTSGSTSTDINNIRKVCGELHHLGLSSFYLFIDVYNMAYYSDGGMIICKTTNPVPGKKENESHYYSDFRDIMAAFVYYAKHNQMNTEDTLVSLSAARNLIMSRESYFDRSITIETISDTASRLNPEFQYYTM